jgi:hypothetical protein
VQVVCGSYYVAYVLPTSVINRLASESLFGLAEEVVCRANFNSLSKVY